jgi:hypothetical protein
MKHYSKFITALLGAVIVTLAAATSDNVLSSAEIAQVALAGLGTFAVYVLPNAPGYEAAKALVSAGLAGVGLLAGWLAAGDTITNSMWLNLALAVGTALGVFVVPNGETTNVIDARG